MFSNFQFERSSFWFGFLAGALFMAVVLRLRVMIPELVRWAKKQAEAARASLTISTENRLRNDTVNYIQRQHLASSLFSLDEILIEPRLMSPLLSADTDVENIYVDITNEAIPYMPDWPELASWYGSPTLSLTDALSEGANIVMIGQPGTGKSTALAYLANLLARNNPAAGALKGRLPLFVHIVDISLQTPPKEIYDPITNAISSYASTLALPRLPELVRTALETSHALLLLDGLDELPVEETAKILPWLQQLLQKYPGLQVVAAGSSDNYAGLNQLGFMPLAIAAWNEQQCVQFIDQWDVLWNKHIASLMPGASEFIDTMLLNHWLKSRESHPTPFEITLKVWSTFAGDMLGNDLPSLIDTHLRRLTANIPNSRQALERAAVLMVNNMKVAASQEDIRAKISEFETFIAAVPEEEEEIAPEPAEEVSPAPEGEESVVSEEGKESKKIKKSKKKPAKAAQPASSGSQLISLFINNGVLVSQANSRLRFFHPLFMAFLAGHALAAEGNVTALVGQPDWPGKWQTLSFAGCFADLSGLVNILLPKSQEDILHRDLFRMARWLRISPKHAPWRANLLRALATLIQKENLSLGLVSRALCALGLSGDPGIGSLFRQWLRADQPNLRRLGALGCGLICDAKAVQELEALIEDPDPIVGKSACLALVGIGNKPALDAVVTTLLQGTELMRRAAAESLVNNTEEGIPTIQEGATVEDLLVRRSVVFGYMRLNQPAFTSTLEKMAVEDGQWVVRNAAAHAMETLRSPNPYIPKPLPPVTNLPWLIEFAGKQGVGVQPGKPAMDLIFKAIENGDEKEKLAAMEYLRLHGNEYGVHRLYSVFFGSLEPVRQAAFDTIWHIGASGVNLPSPVQFGLGKL